MIEFKHMVGGKDFKEIQAQVETKVFEKLKDDTWYNNGAVM
jgi:hypothetical protein